jgi:hypothetical protein
MRIRAATRTSTSEKPDWARRRLVTSGISAGPESALSRLDVCSGHRRLTTKRAHEGPLRHFGC